MSDLNPNSHKLIIDDSIFSQISVDRVQQSNERMRLQLLEYYDFLEENMTLKEMLECVEEYDKNHPEQLDNQNLKTELESFTDELLAGIDKLVNEK